MKTILILTASHLCRNPRVVKEATALGAAGFAVTVLTVAQQSRLVGVDAELVRGLPFKFIAIDHASGAPSARLRSFAARLRTWLARKHIEAAGIETVAALGPVGSLRRRALAIRADLTILHTELPLCLGMELLRAGRRVAVDMEDWYSEDLPLSARRARPVHLLQRAEQTVLNECVASFAPSDAMADQLAGRYRCQRPVVIRNVFPLQPAPTRPIDSNEPIRLIWFSRTVGPGRGIERFLDAWSLTHAPSTVTLLGEVHTAYADSLRARLPHSHAVRLDFAPTVSPGALPAALAAFDVGLALEQHVPLNTDLTISNKIFQYLNAGLAVVATATSGQREVMTAAPRCGILIPQKAAAAEFASELEQLLRDRAQVRRMQVAARAAAEKEYCWERDAPKLISIIDAALAARPTSAA